LRATTHACHRRPMFVRAIVIAGLITAVVAGPASATAIHGRGPGAQAAMDGMLVFGGGGGRVQVLAQLCADPERVRRCTAFPRSLQHAIERSIDRRITWVDDRRVRGPVFWVFAPVTLGLDTAHAAMAWWDPGTFACRGGAELRFSRSHGAWNPTQGTAWEGCPAT